MNAKIRTAVTLAAALFPFGSLPFQESAVAQSASSNCVKVHGNATGVFNGVSVDIKITGAGLLNGTGQVTFDFASGTLPTPEPNSFTYRGDYTINTQQGQLKLRYVALDQVGPPFIHIDIARVVPAASTGRFAGATGVIYTKGDGVNAEFTGEICFANN